MTDNSMGPDGEPADLGAALRSEVPSEGPTFSAEVDARFTSDAAPTPDVVSHRGESPVSRSAPVGPKSKVWPLALAGVAIVIAGIFLANRLTTSTDGPVETGHVSDDLVGLDQLSGPVMNRDHWYAVYGVWDCTADGGAGNWLPAFQSDQDDSGIHSHQDGLIHVHPFFQWSAGTNARLAIWAQEMGITIADDAITLASGHVLSEGQPCGPQGEPATVHLRRWVLDLQVLADPTMPPTVISTDLADQRFYNDREVWIIAYAPLDAEIPLPPRERFDTLTNSVPAFDPADLPAIIAPGIRLHEAQ